MEREIKFRGWLPNERKMTHSHTLKEIVNICSLEYPDDVIWMQFTGLKDKNSVDIYEGDVVKFAVKNVICPNAKCDNNDKLGINNFCPDCGTKVTEKDFITVAKIVYDKGGFCLWYESEEYYTAWQTYIAEVYIAYIEVIGNIHQNPLK